ncbi:MAG: hypothetical protein JWN23_1131 [Rhodocyclales bacterium]|nr:hypothetical protein [Rhodocyclales bacterium]
MSDTPQPSKYAALLNDLCDMQDSIIYAARKNVLIRAEHAIADMEKRLNKAEALVAEQVALAVAEYAALLKEALPFVDAYCNATISPTAASESSYVAMRGYALIKRSQPEQKGGDG